MVTRQSAGILLYRSPPIEVFLVHPGGPFWRNKHAGAWTIPKGEFNAGESALDAAIREFHEETGVRLTGHFQPLSPIRQKGGKLVHAWAIAGELDPRQLVSNLVELEWPRGSGRHISFPEIDKGAWYSLEAAHTMINPAQTGFLDELTQKIKSDP
ncbi:MAG TPA: NUDIX domain-containing protein [Puia sp.]|nr:NUDIX domain-containing protein [Puia sp.]